MRLFRKRNISNEAKRHSAGQTINHKSPFSKLEEPFKVDMVSNEFMEKWMIGFYMDTFFDHDNNDDDFLTILQTIDRDTVKQQLGFFNWRCRLIGAYFSAVLNLREFEDTIGINLLKSELCYAGEGYLIAISSFNTDKSITYLKKYLDYYLTRTDLVFEQGTAMAALRWIDERNNSNIIADNSYMEKWSKYNQKNPNMNLEHYIKSLNKKMTKVEKFKKDIIEVFAGSSIEAEIVKSMLQDSDINVFLKNEYMGTIAPWHISAGGAGAVKIIINSNDYEKAKLIIEKYEKSK